MGPRRVRFEARVFRDESLAFEACTGFRRARGADSCHCGWPQEDHRPGIRPDRVPLTDLLRRPAPLPVAFTGAARRAS